MSSASDFATLDLVPDALKEAQRRDADAWLEELADAFDDRRRTSGFLSLAENAIRDCPGDPHILCLAATAALIEGHNERALVFLKRFTKRYVPTGTVHLLQALALAQQNKLAPARVLLQSHGLTDVYAAVRVFPGGAGRRTWLYALLDAIVGRPAGARRRAGGKAAAKPLPKTKPQPKSKLSSAERPQGTATAPIAARPAALPVGPTELPRIAIDIPFTVEIDLAPLLAAVGEPPAADADGYRLRERLAHLSLAQGFDELLCLPHLRGLDTLWHQVETVRKVLKQFRGRVLLADEVGLGKTVEAGMVLKEYMLRGMAERVLIVVPASLVGQWREELETKFGIDCATTQDALLRDDPEAFWDQPRLIASLALARRREHADRLARRSFDVVIVDEAHHLRDRASQSYKLVDGLNKRFLLLLSATPVQNDLIELYNLLTLLKPGIFKTLKEFRTVYLTPGKPRQPANPEQLRQLMRGAMIRSTRAAVALRLPRRHATTIRVDGQPAERAAYDALAASARDLAARGGSGRHRLALRHLLGAAGSSPAAAAAAVERFAGRYSDEPGWPALAARWAALGTGGKEAALLDLLRRNPGEKTLVFVQYRETLAHLAALLTKAGIAFARFDGSLAGPDKDAAIAAFRDEVPVLLSTESGGEGRNIQFCNTLVNFDVPWNPMTIEQRIGRIDRIGQKREVFVFNLVTRGSLEEQVLRLLEEKISMFELVVGEIGAILGGIEDEQDFAELVLDAWLETTDAARRDAFTAIGRRLDEARQQHDGATKLDEELFGQDFETA